MVLAAMGTMRLLGCITVILAMSACGGGVAAPLGSSTGTVDAGGVTGGGPGGGGFSGGLDTLALRGGVLATFRVGTEQFRGWFPDGYNADRLVEASAGIGAPITTICTDVVPGSGRGAHNDPWRWSVAPTDVLTQFNAPACALCNNPFRTPTQVENNVVSGTLNCKHAPAAESALTLPPGPITPTRYGAFMQVALVSVQDFR